MPRPRRRHVTLLAAAAVVLAAGAGAVAVVPTAQAATLCQAQYYAIPQANGSFSATVEVSVAEMQNTWAITWDFPGDQVVTEAWSSEVAQVGKTVTARNLATNGVIPAGGSVTFGIQGTYSVSNASPTEFTLNGAPCTGGLELPDVDEPAAAPAGQPGVEPTTEPTATVAQPAGCGTATLCDGFESQAAGAPSGDWTLAYPNCQGTGTATIDTAVAHSGTKSVRVDGGAGYCNHVFVKATTSLTSVGSNVFGRYYVRHTTALPPAHVTFMAMRDENEGKDLRMGGQNSALQWNRESDDATLPEQSPNGVALSKPLPTNVWNCVEFQVDGSAGHIRTWLDGTEVPGLVVDGAPTNDIDRQWLNKANWRPALSDLRLGWESYGDGANTLWFDDVAIGTARIGC